MTDGHETFPNKFEAFYLVAAMIAVQFVIGAAVIEGSLFEGLNWEGVSAMVTVIGNGIMFVFLLTYKRMSYGSLFHPAGNSVIATLSTLVLPILILVPGLVTLTGGLNMIVHWLLPMSEQDHASYDAMMEVNVIPIFFGCVAAPLLEEMLFRGLILRSFLQQYSRTAAILWSALIFALAHLNAYQFFTAFILGIVVGWLYERTRSLWPPIFLHAAFNTFVTYSVNSDAAASGGGVWLLGLAFLGTIVGGLMLLRILEPAAARAE